MILKEIERLEQKVFNVIAFKNMKICELGNQIHWTGIPAKQLYEAKGYNHTSIDINGKDGALKIDLCKPIPKNMHTKFDLVTNYGTSEHILNQLMLFKNLVNLCKHHGYLLCVFPIGERWHKHSPYYYNFFFCIQLADALGLRLILFKKFDIKRNGYQLFVLYHKIGRLSVIKFYKLSRFIHKTDSKRYGDYA